MSNVLLHFLKCVEFNKLVVVVDSRVCKLLLPEDQVQLAEHVSFDLIVRCDVPDCGHVTPRCEGLGLFFVWEQIRGLRVAGAVSVALGRPEHAWETLLEVLWLLSNVREI